MAGTLGILLAGGRGTRLGLGVPKALAPWAGGTLLSHALATLRAAKQQEAPVPTIALTANQLARDQAIEAGADEVLANPPPFADLQVVLVRALSKPVAVRPVTLEGVA